VCGARVVAVEPGSAAGTALARNIALNKLENRVSVEAVALGDTFGELPFSSGQDPTNHVLSHRDEQYQKVRQTTADLLFADETPLAMKLDVEGYEPAVLAGAPATLANPGLKALIVELNGIGSRYGVQRSRDPSQFAATRLQRLQLRSEVPPAVAATWKL
jgi:FkbM family methyltransferase